MVRENLILDLNHELFVDNFAGGGGASTGIEWGLGRHVDQAYNHAADALGMHRINHPQTVHYCQDIFEVDPPRVTEGRRVGGAWFSPDCKHFSKAKGGKPLSKKIRGLAFVILRWAKIRARVIYMENVEEIQTWGPLLKNGKPDKAQLGRTWKAFLAALGSGVAADHPDLEEILAVLGGSVTREELIRGFGYTIETKELRACDYGAPTIRKRLFLIARCDGLPIVWPEPTHFAPEKLSAARKQYGRQVRPWRTAAECIDWSLPCNSIFLDGEAAKLARCKRPLAKATLRRIATGIDRHVLKAKQPFIVRVAHGDVGTNGSKRWGQPTHSVDKPLGTQSTSNEFALVNASVAPFVTEHANASNQRTMAIDEPLRTQCAEVKGGHFALVSGSLVQTGYGERKGQQPRALDLNKPLGTAVSGVKHAVVAANLVKLRGTNVGDKADAPVHTASAGGCHHGVVTSKLAPLIVQNNSGFNRTPHHPVTKPVSTITAVGSQQCLVTANTVAYYGNDQNGQGVDTPLRTTTTKERFGLVESRSAHPELSPEQLSGAQRVAAFLRDHGIQFEGEFAMVCGCVIYDIGLRMFTPRELFRAQGFADSYVIDKAWLVNPKTGEIKEVTLTKTQQIRMCGNSVCPPVAAALVAANSGDMAVWRKGERRKLSELMAA